MVQYSIEFPIDGKSSVADVVRLAHEWIAGSRHTKLKKKDFDVLPENSEVTVSNIGESVTTGLAKVENLEIGGVRWIHAERENLEWTTAVVATRTENECLLSIQVICEALSTASRLPEPKKPVFVGQVLNRFGGGMDGQIPVAEKPFILNEDEVAIAAALMSGAAGNKLPIVYVSATYQGSHILDPKILSKALAGMAHVIVEPSRAFSATLREETDSRNVYGGNVGVYWPESNARKSYYLENSDEDATVIPLSIAKDVRVALANRRQRTNCNWLYLKEMISRCRYEALKATDSIELNEYVKVWDADKKAKDARIVEAEGEIERLKSELRRQNVVNQSSSSGLLRIGVEQNLYESEIFDVVVSSLSDHQKTILSGTRRDHIIADLLKHNPVKGNGDELQNRVRAALKTYVTMNAKTRSELQRIGFDISEDGKHYKLVFQGDGRYTFSVSKTSSDHRAGKNMASDINKKLF